MNSFNHYSLGSVGEWLFRHVAESELGSGSARPFNTSCLKPYLPPLQSQLTFAARARLFPKPARRNRQPLAAQRHNPGVVHPRADNTSARVFIPCDPATEVTEATSRSKKPPASASTQLTAPPQTAKGGICCAKPARRLYFSAVSLAADSPNTATSLATSLFDHINHRGNCRSGRLVRRNLLAAPL